MIVTFPTALPTMYLADQMIARLDVLWQSHTKNLDFSNMLPMGSTGAYSNWVSHMTLTGLSSGSYALRIGTLSIDMETGVVLGSTISVTTGTNYG
jgi:hypothetical protein